MAAFIKRIFLYDSELSTSKIEKIQWHHSLDKDNFLKILQWPIGTETKISLRSSEDKAYDGF